MYDSDKCIQSGRLLYRNLDHVKVHIFLPRCIECRRGLATSIVCQSVCPSTVKRVYCDKTEEKTVQIFIPYERSFSLVS